MDSIRIKPAASGKLIALQESAVQVGGEERYLQGIELLSRQLTIATLRTATAADSVDISSLTGLGTAVDVGDCHIIVALPYHSQDNGVCRITPIVDYGSAVGILATKESGVGAALFHDGAAYPSPALVWDVFGGEVVYLHITHLSGLNTVTIKGGAI